MTTAVEVADRLYERWNADGVAVLGDCVDPAIVLITDPLRPVESALRGPDGWKQWVARWDDAYEHVRIVVDGLVPVDDEHVLALVSITATPIAAAEPLRWAAAHLWTLRDGRIAGWATHLDLAAARDTLDV
jgi:ketosteroid isomerase-like protein